MTPNVTFINLNYQNITLASANFTADNVPGDENFHPTVTNRPALCIL